MRPLFTSLFVLLLSGITLADEVQRRTANDGQLVMEGIPEIPEDLAPVLDRYQEIHTARFAAWSQDSKSIFIKTQPGNVTQLHRVSEPGGARSQITFGKEPVGEVVAQPNGKAH